MVRLLGNRFRRKGIPASDVAFLLLLTWARSSLPCSHPLALVLWKLLSSIIRSQQINASPWIHILQGWYLWLENCSGTDLPPIVSHKICHLVAPNCFMILRAINKASYSPILFVMLNLCFAAYRSFIEWGISKSMPIPEPMDPEAPSTYNFHSSFFSSSKGTMRVSLATKYANAYAFNIIQGAYLILYAVNWTAHSVDHPSRSCLWSSFLRG